MHPRHLVAAGLFLISPQGRFLLVQTFNRIGAGLILAGGMVEDNESPATAASREVAEEVGLRVKTGRLLAVEHRAKVDGRPSSLHFVFTAEDTVDEDAVLELQPEEIAETHWVHRDQVAQLHGPAGRPLMHAALAALDSGVPGYLET